MINQERRFERAQPPSTIAFDPEGPLAVLRGDEMSSKYVTDSTEHADRMLRIRGTGPTASVMGSWERGLCVDIPATVPVPRHDEARYDAQSAVVIFRGRGILTTYYGLSPEHVVNVHGVTVPLAVDAQHGTEYAPRIDPVKLELVDL